MDQNQTPPPPNYDFILNQPDAKGDLPGATPPVKKNKKKLIIAIVLGALLLVVVPLAIFSSKKTKPNTTPQDTLTNQLANTPKTSQEQTVQDFLKSLVAGQYEAAYSKLEQTPAVVAEKQKYISQTAPDLNKLINFNNCAISTPNTKLPNTVEVTCLFENGGRGVYDFTMTEQNGSTVIAHYTTKEVTS